MEKRLPLDREALLYKTENEITVILGYRRFLWKKLHIEYQLWADYDLWKEFRLGFLLSSHVLLGRPLYFGSSMDYACLNRSVSWT